MPISGNGEGLGDPYPQFLPMGRIDASLAFKAAYIQYHYLLYLESLGKGRGDEEYDLTAKTLSLSVSAMGVREEYLFRGVMQERAGFLQGLMVGLGFYKKTARERYRAYLKSLLLSELDGIRGDEPGLSTGLRELLAQHKRLLRHDVGDFVRLSRSGEWGAEGEQAEVLASQADLVENMIVYHVKSASGYRGLVPDTAIDCYAPLRDPGLRAPRKKKKRAPSAEDQQAVEAVLQALMGGR